MIPDHRGLNGRWQEDPEAEKLVTYEYYMGELEIRCRSWQVRRKNRILNAQFVRDTRHPTVIAKSTRAVVATTHRLI
jgi:hypothetical protein